MDDPPRSVLARGLALLAAFADAPSPSPELTLGELTDRTGLPSATVHRLVAELVAWGALERSSRGRYRIGMRLWRIGTLAPGARDLREAALPAMQDLAAVTGDVVHLVVIDHDQALFLERLPGRHTHPVRSRVGRPLPVHASGPGKVMLAHSGAATVESVLARGLPRVASGTITDPDALRQELVAIRRAGFCLSRDEMTDGSSSVAAPIRDADGTVVAALAVVVTSATANLLALVPAVRMAAATTSRRLGPVRPEFSTQ